LTLIHGPNGVGKTTVLRAIDALFNTRLSALARVPFSTISAVLSDGRQLQVTRQTSQEPTHRGSRSTLRFNGNDASGRAYDEWTYLGLSPNEVPLHMLDSFIEEVTRTGPDEWLDLRTGELLDLDQVIDRYGDQVPGIPESAAGPPMWLRNVLGFVPVYFIEAQRLVSSPSRRSKAYRHGLRESGSQVPTVKLHAEDLAAQIRKTLAAYGDYSQVLDSTFPKRLLEEQDDDATPKEDSIREQYAAQVERRSDYVRVGLLDAGSELPLPDRELKPHEERVLSMHLTDANAKLDQLSDLSSKLDLLLSVINSKFRRKTLAVDRERGFTVTTRDGSALDLSSLSSGEQQELVLTYGLLFGEKRGTLVLVDEPELSLHVSWQMDLIPDLLKIAEIAGLEFLVATHSPQVIGEYWNLTVELNDGV
jgi:hypothetical protein